MTMPFRLRPMRPSDRALVAHSWRASYEGAPAVRGADRDHYRAEMIKTVDRLLDKAQVRVACDPEDEDTIVGWVAFTGREFHWAYVKDAFRNECKVPDLLEGVPIDAYTFRGREIERALLGLDGCEYKTDPKGSVVWSPPRGWRFTPRFTI